ncbi:MAG: tripartite tricarboxylate transporter substrate binding protein [Proteobacteria bacterium]|nr:tripartite tricarboxylate transporter substrate binding protein [Burkholderiales bacterium]
MFHRCTLSSPARSASTRALRIVTLAVFAIGTVVQVSALHAQPSAATFPMKPVRIIVPFAPGGQSDIISRTVGQKMSEQWGQPVIYENRGGAGGTLGIDAMVRAPADGYTIGSGSQSALSIAQHLYGKLSYDPLKDVQAVVTLVLTPYVVTVNSRVPATNMAELVKIARSKSGRLSFGSSGSGSISHIAAELFADAIGATLLHVPYKGTAPALTGVATGEIDMMFADLTPVQPHLDSGRAKLVAIAGTRRSSAAPGVSTVAEQGIKMPAIDGRYGFVVPAGTPREVVNRIQAASVAALKMPDVRARFDQLGYAIVGDTPDQYAQAIRAESDAFGKVIRSAGIRAE